MVYDMTSFVDLFGGNTVPPSDFSYVNYSVTANVAFVWPFQYSGTGNIIADIVELNVTVAALTATLPPADSVSVGTDVLIRNTGTQTITVNDNGNNLVATLAAGEAKFIYVTDNSTDAGVWGVFTFGTGTSAADASTLAGYGLRTLLGKLSPNHAYLEVNANYVLTTADRGKLVNVVAGSVTVTTPAAATVEDGYFVLIRNTAAGSLTLEGNAAETIDGSLTKTIAPGESCIIATNGANWFTVGYGRDATFVFSEYVVDSASGSVTLSSSDVAGRMIRVGGTAVANIDVTLPSVDNIYFVNIESSVGAFTVTFKTSAGTTAVLSSDQRTLLYCDGSNVSIAVTTALTTTLSLPDGSAAVPSLFFASDTNTGLYRPGNDSVGITTGGVSRAIVANAQTTFDQNISFSSTGRRITGDMSNATFANRLTFQSTTVNGNSILHVAPNGTAVQSGYRAETDSALTTGSVLMLDAFGGSDVRITSAARGAGTILPMAFFAGTTEWLRASNTGKVGMGLTPGANNLLRIGGALAAADANIISVENTTAGATSLARVVVTADANTAYLSTYGATFATAHFAGRTGIANYTAGLLFIGGDAVSTIDFFTGGDVAGDLALRIEASGNLNFKKTSQRIQGDFSNATQSVKASFHSSTTDGATTVGAIPNGTSTTSAFQTVNNSDSDNATIGTLRTTTTSVDINVTKSGTGVLKPLSLMMDSVAKLTVATGGNVEVSSFSKLVRCNGKHSSDR